MDENFHSSGNKGTLIAAFTFGVIFVIAIILIAFFRPEPKAFEYTIYRIVLALAAAGVGAVLPGFLDVSFKNWLRAGGALAIFVIVYFFPPVSPSSVTVIDPVIEPKADAKPTADIWLHQVDSENYQKAYDSMAQSFRDTYPYKQFEEILGPIRKGLGMPVHRTVVSTSPFVSPPGAKKGAYRLYVYQTDFAKQPKPVYESILMFAEGDKWLVNGFQYATRTNSGQFVPYIPTVPNPP